MPWQFRSALKGTSIGCDKHAIFAMKRASEEELEPLAIKKISKAITEEKNGDVDFCPVYNDSQDRSMILLTGLRTIFQKQLPNMPKEYIARLVYDRSHVAVVVCKDLKVLGGITYKPFVEQEFAEIVFCAIDTTCQVQGISNFIRLRQ